VKQAYACLTVESSQATLKAVEGLSPTVRCHTAVFGAHDAIRARYAERRVPRRATRLHGRGVVAADEYRRPASEKWNP